MKNTRPPSIFSSGLPSDYKINERILAPIPGRVVQVFVRAGDTVERGSPLLIIEAMKMHNMIRSASTLKVSAVQVEAGQVVKAGDLLVQFQKD